MKYRIVMLYSRSFVPHEGWYRRVYNQAKTLVNAGCDVTLLAWDRLCRYPKEEILDGIRIQRFWIPAKVGQGPKNATKHWQYSRALVAYLLTCDFDIVHCFNVDTMIAGLWSAKRKHKKAVLDLCEPDYYRGFWRPGYNWLLRVVNWIEKALACRFDHLFVHSTYQIDKFRAYGIDRMTQVGSYPNRSLLATSLKKPDSDRVVIGRLGTVYANNGYKELVAAFQMLLDRRSRDNERPQYKLRIAGMVLDTYRDTFATLVEPLGDHVEITGAFDVAELRELYREIDISLIFQGSKGFSNVTPTKLFDSMACGVPVIANAIGDVARIVDEGPCGVIVDEKDPTSICGGIEKLAVDRELRGTMANNAIRLAHDKYTWEAVASNFLTAYDKL